MVERLLNGEKRPSGEAYRRATVQILEAENELSQRLAVQDRQWLEKLGDAYGQRERVVTEAAFREGFCRAALLALDVLAYQAGLPED